MDIFDSAHILSFGCNYFDIHSNNSEEGMYKINYHISFSQLIGETCRNLKSMSIKKYMENAHIERASNAYLV